jgi:hypothetical protein
MKSAISAIALAILATTSADAQTYVPPIGQRIKSGVPTRVFTWFNCEARGGPGYGATGVARHGTISVREARQNRCGMTDYPVAELWYTSQAGFRGRDELFLFSQWGSRTSKTVTVE